MGALIEEIRVRQADAVSRVFAVLMPLEALVAVVLAHVASRGLAGAAVAAVATGIAGGATVIACVRPGARRTTWTVGIAQALLSALLIQIAPSDIRFLLVASVPLIAFYRDWRLVVASSLVAVCARFALGGISPDGWSLMAAAGLPWWQLVAWVSFQNAFLVHMCRTARRQWAAMADARAELYSSRDRYQAVVADTFDAVLVFSAADGRLLEYNTAFARLVRLPHDDASWRSGAVPSLLVTDALLPGDVSLSSILGDLASGAGSWRGERLLHRVDGTLVDLDCTFNQTTIAGEAAVGAVLRDISDRKRVEKAVADAHDTAMAAARARTEFLANVSHELRTPMNGVIGMLGLLADTPLTPEQRDYVETIQGSGNDMLALVNDLLDLASAESGRLQFDDAEFDPRLAIEGVLDLLAGAAVHGELELVGLVDPDVPARVRGDAGRFRQVLMNLVDNAVKFTSEGDVEVHLAVESRTDNQVVLRCSVRDTGIGIARDDQDRVFQAFEQGDTSSTRRYGGSGLGLTISRRIVEHMGGTIGVSSCPGLGSTFWFTICLGVPTPAVTGASDAPMSPVTVPPGARVLVVDDHATSLTMLQALVGGWGAAVRTSGSGVEALQMLQQADGYGCPFDVVLVDRRMPGLDGVRFAGQLQRSGLRTPPRVILLTPLTDVGEWGQLATDGFDDLATKPIKARQLHHVLLRALLRPGAASAASREPRRSVAGASDLSRRPRILVAEDNATTAKLVILQLRELGYFADRVFNGLEVLEALREIHYDLVLMDCQMPQLDGYAATGAIRRLPGAERDIPIVGMTAPASHADLERCLETGMNDYISKPVRLSELAGVVGTVLAAHPEPVPRPV